MSRFEGLLQLPGIKNAIGKNRFFHSNARALAATSLPHSNISNYAHNMKTHRPLSKNNGYINLNKKQTVPYQIKSGTYYIIDEHYDDKKFLIVLQTNEGPIVIPFSREANSTVQYKYQNKNFSSIKSLIVYYCRINPNIVINGLRGIKVEPHLSVWQNAGKRTKRARRTRRTRRTRKN